MRKVFRFLVTLFLVAALSPAVTVPAAASDGLSFNAGSGYTAVIIDDADLLSPAEEQSLLESMKPLTEYGSIAVITVDTPSALDEDERAGQARRELFGSSTSAVFMIDMYNRWLRIDSSNSMYDKLSSAQAANIINNVYSYASSGDYAGCCEAVVSQMYSCMAGNRVPSAMKYICNACIALITAGAIGFALAVKTSTTYILPTQAEVLGGMKTTFDPREVSAVRINSKQRYSPVSSGAPRGGASGGGSRGGYSGGYRGGYSGGSHGSFSGGSRGGFSGGGSRGGFSGGGRSGGHGGRF